MSNIFPLVCHCCFFFFTSNRTWWISSVKRDVHPITSGVLMVCHFSFVSQCICSRKYPHPYPIFKVVFWNRPPCIDTPLSEQFCFVLSFETCISWYWKHQSKYLILFKFWFQFYTQLAKCWKMCRTSALLQFTIERQMHEGFNLLYIVINQLIILEKDFCIPT